MDFDAGEKDVFIVAALIKQFFRELPEPLIPHHLHSKVFEWTGTKAEKLNIDLMIEIDEPEYKLKSLRSLIGALPVNNRKLIKFMVNFFRSLDSSVPSNSPECISR
jgi:hypothetical protein